MDGLEIDCGGEGRHPRAVNLNPSAIGRDGRPIPRLIVGRCERMPIASSVAAVIRVESSPLEPGAAEEIARVLRPGGKVILIHPDTYAAERHPEVAEAVGGSVRSFDLSGMTVTVIQSDRA
jgi:hypothetical protein